MHEKRNKYQLGNHYLFQFQFPDAPHQDSPSTPPSTPPSRHRLRHLNSLIRVSRSNKKHLCLTDHVVAVSFWISVKVLDFEPWDNKIFPLNITSFQILTVGFTNCLKCFFNRANLRVRFDCGMLDET